MIRGSNVNVQDRNPLDGYIMNYLMEQLVWHNRKIGDTEMKTKKVTIKQLREAVNKVRKGKNPEYDEPVPYIPPTKKQIEKFYKHSIEQMFAMVKRSKSV